VAEAFPPLTATDGAALLAVAVLEADPAEALVSAPVVTVALYAVAVELAADGPTATDPAPPPAVAETDPTLALVASDGAALFAVPVAVASPPVVLRSSAALLAVAVVVPTPAFGLSDSAALLAVAVLAADPALGATFAAAWLAVAVVVATSAGPVSSSGWSVRGRCGGIG
jgi:hypothetical protein